MLRKFHNYFFEEDAEMSLSDKLAAILLGLSCIWAAYVVIMVGVS